MTSEKEQLASIAALRRDAHREGLGIANGVQVWLRDLRNGLSAFDALAAERDGLKAEVERLTRDRYAEEYMSVSISRDGHVESHNAFGASFPEMVAATRNIIAVLQQRLDNRALCPFASGKELLTAPVPQDWKARAEAAEAKLASSDLRSGDVEGLVEALRPLVPIPEVIEAVAELPDEMELYLDGVQAGATWEIGPITVSQLRAAANALAAFTGPSEEAL
jgi:hypothetical protein